MPLAAISIELSGVALLLLPFWIAAIGMLSGRVLGIRIGRWRSALAATIGWLLGAVATVATLGPDEDSPAIVIPLVIFFGVLATLPVAIVLDLVARRAPGRTPQRRWRHPIRAVRGGVRRPSAAFASWSATPARRTSSTSVTGRSRRSTPPIWRVGCG